MDLLRDSAWQGVGAVVALAALALHFYVERHRLPPWLRIVLRFLPFYMVGALVGGGLIYSSHSWLERRFGDLHTPIIDAVCIAVAAAAFGWVAAGWTGRRILTAYVAACILIGGATAWLTYLVHPYLHVRLGVYDPIVTIAFKVLVILATALGARSWVGPRPALGRR